jgi:deoxyribose-phosphate aldolase|tara:strand:- start:1811 stop:2455 length:645 start_codon:yes stop_codon:yes gene_type:complete
MESVSNYIDHTNLSQTATQLDIKNLCKEAIENDFSSVCVNPVFVPLAADILNNENPKVCTVVGFPLGADSSEMKFAESRYLIHRGAQELDMVINISALKDGNTSLIQSEIEKVVDAADGNCVKVIIETCLLSNEEIKLASKITVASGADFVKTSTGFSFAGASKKDVQLIRKTIGPDIGVKASGGVKTLADLKKMIQAGANRIGTSNAISIINE